MMSEYQRFKQWFGQIKQTTTGLSHLLDKSIITELVEDITSGKFNGNAATDAVIAISYAQHISKALQTDIEQLKSQKTELVSLIDSIYSISYDVGAPPHQKHLGNRCECRQCVDQRVHDVLAKFKTAE